MILRYCLINTGEVAVGNLTTVYIVFFKLAIDIYVRIFRGELMTHLHIIKPTWTSNNVGCEISVC